MYRRQSSTTTRLTTETASSKNQRSQPYSSLKNSSVSSYDQRKGSRQSNPQSELTTKEVSTREFSEYSPQFLSNVQSRKGNSNLFDLNLIFTQATAPDINYPPFMFRTNSVQSTVPFSNDYRSFVSTYIDPNEPSGYQSPDHHCAHCDLCGIELIEGTNIPKQTELRSPATTSKTNNFFTPSNLEAKARSPVELSHSTSRQISMPSSPRDQETFRKLKEKFAKNREEYFDKMRKDPWVPTRSDFKH